MCLINSNIIETENKEVKRNSDITYEERCKIEFMVKKKQKKQLHKLYIDFALLLFFEWTAIYKPKKLIKKY